MGNGANEAVRVGLGSGSGHVERFAPRWIERAECGNPACAGSWLGFLKDRRRPVFEGRWGCSRQCLEVMARTAVRRELGEAAAGEQTIAHRHRMPLGLILLAHGWITEAQLLRALELQRCAQRGRIGEWLIKECGLDESCVLRALGMQWGCPLLSMKGFDAQAMALAAPRLLVEETGMLPLRIAAERTLYLAFAERPDSAMALAMKLMSGLRVESGLVEKQDWRQASARLAGCEFVDATFERVSNMELLPGRIAAAVNNVQPKASRLVRVRSFYWLRMWLESGAMLHRDGGLPRTKEDVMDRLYSVGAEQ